MTLSVDGGNRRLGAALLQGQDPAAILAVIATVIAYRVLDELTASVASLAPDDRLEPFLFGRAVVVNPVPFALLLVGLAVAKLRGWSRLWTPWAALEHGTVLRWMTAPVLVLVVWYGALYEYNYFLDQWHLADRMLVLALAAGAWYRPVLLVPVVLQARVVADQFLSPFAATASENIGELLLIALLVLAAMHLVITLTGRRDTSPAILLLAAAVAAHFFVPGVEKLRIDWATTTDLGNFALSSYTAGWLGAGDGNWARDLAELADRLKVLLLAGSLVLEVGAVVAVAHRRLLRWWLVGWVLLHASIFLMSGFWLFEWIVVEVVLFVVLTRSDLHDWISRNETPARALLAVGLVIAGGPLFHPPKLAWLDSPVSYGYEIEATGVSGEEYHVPLSAFEPLQQSLSLLFAHFRPHREAVSGYGAIGSQWLLDRLEAISTFDELEAFEQTLRATPTETRAASEALIVRWFDNVNHGDRLPAVVVSPPARFWTSRPSPSYHFQEPLTSVEVVLVTSIHDGTSQRFSRSTVLTVVVGDHGRAVVTDRVEEPTDA